MVKITTALFDWEKNTKDSQGKFLIIKPVK